MKSPASAGLYYFTHYLPYTMGRGLWSIVLSHKNACTFVTPSNMISPSSNMYFVAVVLPSELNTRILEYKRFMFDKYGSKVGLKSPAHITLIPPFWMEGDKERSLISDIDSINSRHQPFRISTNNFSAFKPRTIFIDVQPNEQLSSLKKTGDDFFKSNTFYKLKVDTRPFHPHITIATRDLHKKDFYEAWPFFQKETFKEEWITNGVSLLRHNKRNWDVIHTSQFGNYSL